MRLYRVVEADGSNDEWCADATAADAAVARRLGLTPGQVEPLRWRISVDPIVVRRDGARWRSRQIWHIRSGERLLRVDEMLQVDEAAYDH